MSSCLHSCVPFYEPDVRNVAVSRKATKQWMLFFLKPQPLALFVGLGPRAHLKLANKDRVRIGTHQVWGLKIAIKNFWGMPWRYDVVDWCHDLRWIVWNGMCPCQMFFTFPVPDDEIWADHCSLHALITKSSKSYRQLACVFGKQIFTMLYRVVSSHVVSFHIMLFYFMVYHISYGISHHRRAGAYHYGMFFRIHHLETCMRHPMKPTQLFMTFWCSFQSQKFRFQASSIGSLAFFWTKNPKRVGQKNRNPSTNLQQELPFRRGYRQWMGRMGSGLVKRQIVTQGNYISGFE